MDPRRSLPRLAAWALVPAAVAVGALLYRVDPVRPGVYPPCPLHALTGYHCPGCGSLRAMHRLLHGEVLAAWRYNPLLVVSIPALGLLMLWPRLAYHPWTPRIVLVIVLAFWLLRNIPAWPCTLLAPPNPVTVQAPTESAAGRSSSYRPA